MPLGRLPKAMVLAYYPVVLPLNHLGWQLTPNRIRVCPNPAEADHDRRREGKTKA